MRGRSLRAVRKMEDALKAAQAEPLILRRRDGLRRRGAFLLRWRGRNKKRRRENMNTLENWPIKKVKPYDRNEQVYGDADVKPLPMHKKRRTVRSSNTRTI